MLDFVLNFLFPQICVICGKRDSNWLCNNCKNRIVKLEKNILLEGSKSIKELLNYKEKIYFDKMFYCFEYKNIIRKLLLQYKFFDKSYLSNFFANVILNNKKINEILENYDIMIPVPISREKRRQRGYNQTELIVKRLNKKSNCQVLKKVKNTKTQSTLNSFDRKSNVKDAFVIKDNTLIKGKNIVLFDDICTTGATVNEISKKLKLAGANKILVLVIAKD